MSFGIQLGVEMSTLKRFEDSRPRNLRENFAEMLQYWLDNTTNPTWQAIFEALEAIQNRRLAAELKRKHRPEEKGIFGYIKYSTYLCLMLLSCMLYLVETFK